MVWVHAGLVVPSIPADYIADQCRKKCVRIRGIDSLKKKDGSILYYVVRFCSEGDMINASIAKILEFSVFPLKAHMSTQNPVLYSRPQVDGEHARVELQGGSQMSFNINEISAAVQSAVQEGRIFPREEFSIPVKSIYETNFAAASQGKLDPLSKNSTALLIAQGSECDKLATKCDGLLLEAENMLVKKGNEPSRSRSKARKSEMGAARLARLAEDADGDALSGCSTSADYTPAYDLLDSIQQLLPPPVSRQVPISTACGRRQAFLLLPAASVGHVVGARFAAAKRIAARAGPTARVTIVVVDGVYDDPAPLGTACLRVAADTGAAVEDALRLLRPRAARVMTELSLLTPPPGLPLAPEASPFPAQAGAEEAVTSYGRQSQEQNCRMREIKRLLASAGRAQARGRKARRRAPARSTDAAGAGAASTAGGPGGLWVLCLDAGPGPANPRRIQAGGVGRRPGGGTAGQEPADGGELNSNRFAPLPNEPASALEGLDAGALGRRRRKLAKALRAARGLEARRAAGERLSADQEGKARRAGALARELERVEEALRELPLPPADSEEP